MSRTDWLLPAGAALLVLAPFLLVKTPAGGEVFLGTDDKASLAIEVLRPGYRPWATPLWTPPSKEIESLLFALQASLGSGAIAYAIGHRNGRRNQDK